MKAIKKLSFTITICILLSVFSCIVYADNSNISLDQMTDYEKAVAGIIPADDVLSPLSANANANLDNDIYYINNKCFGDYIGVSGGKTTPTSGLISNLGNSILWKIQQYNGSYTITLNSDPNKYLCAPMYAGANEPAVESYSGTTLENRFLWDITVAVGGGCLIKNKLMSKYLYTDGVKTYISANLDGANGDESYDSRVWRCLKQSFAAGKELSDTAKFPPVSMSVGGSAQATINQSASTTLWISGSDFEYDLKTTPHVSVTNNGIFTGNSNGVTVVIARHKPTDLKFIFPAVVGNRPTYTVTNYVDQGYVVRFGSITPVQTYNAYVKGRLYDICGISYTTYVNSHTSCADNCKIQTYGSVTFAGLADSCSHNPKHNLTSTGLRNGITAGTPTNTKVIWTGHILPGNPSSNSSNGHWSVVMTPKHTTNALSGYSNRSPDVIIYQSLFTLMHELGHQLSLPDHYCYDAPAGQKCGRIDCYDCYEGEPCVMHKREDIRNVNNLNMFCPSCLEKLAAHLSDHH